MAEWRPKGGGLERVLGTGALFSTAYGNVGSSIYYGIGVVALLALLNVIGIREAAGINIVLAGVDFVTQLLLVILGCILVLSPDTLVHNIHLGTAPTWTDFLIAIPVGMVAYTGIETI